MTMTEKILARHSGNANVAPGMNVWTTVDKLMTHDVCGPGTFGIFQKEFGEDAQVRLALLLFGVLIRVVFAAAPKRRALAEAR
jgi:homoaconitase/3-isopropylmalate dehydratase large subunit